MIVIQVSIGELKTPGQVGGWEFACRKEIPRVLFIMPVTWVLREPHIQCSVSLPASYGTVIILVPAFEVP